MRTLAVIVGGSGTSLSVPFVMDGLLPRWGWALILLASWLPAVWVYRHDIATWGKRARLPRGVRPQASGAEISKATLGALCLGGVLACAYYVFFIHELPTKPVWTHPTFSAAAQAQAEAECRMRATEMYRNRLRNWNEHARYVADCLIAKGFRRE